MIRYGSVIVLCLTSTALFVYNAKIALSVAVGGAIGLVNLVLWQQVVIGMLKKATRGDITWFELLGSMLLKLAILGILVAALLKTSLSPWPMMIGYGGSLVGMLWQGWIAKEQSGS